MIADKLKKSTLQAAIQGKLTQQLPTDGDAKDLLNQIRAEKSKLIADKKIKPDKPLPPIQPDELPFDIPQNWCWCRLGDVVQINPRNKLDNGIVDATFLPMTAINGGYGNSYVPLVRTWTEINTGFTHFANGDVIFAKITPCFQNRKSAVVENLINGIGAGTTEIYVLRSYGKNIIAKYLLYFVKNQQFISDGLATMKGTAGQQRVSRDFVTNYIFPLPPLAEQKRIVEQLEKILPEVELLAESEHELDDLQKNFPRQIKNSILQDAIQGKLTQQLTTDGDAKDLLEQIRAEKNKLIADKKIKPEKPLPPIQPDELPFDIPKNWTWVRLGELGHYKKGPFGSALTKSIFVPKDVDTIRVYEQKNAIQKNAHIGDYYITKKYFDEKMSGFEILSGDIIVSCAGTIGESFIMPKDMEKGIINQALMRMRIFNPMNLSYFLLMFDFILKQNAQSKSKGSAIKNIPPFEILKNFLVPLPPLA